MNTAAVWSVKTHCVRPVYLHEVVRALHLGHEVLHGLLSHHRVAGRWRGHMVPGDGCVGGQQGRGRVLQGGHHLLDPETHRVTDRSTGGIVEWSSREWCSTPAPPPTTPPRGLFPCCCTMLFLECIVCLQTASQHTNKDGCHPKTQTCLSNSVYWFLMQHLSGLHFNWLREFFSCCSFWRTKTRYEDFF